MEINKRIMELENELAILPQGSINIKKIKGKANIAKKTNEKRFLQG